MTFSLRPLCQERVSPARCLTRILRKETNKSRSEDGDKTRNKSIGWRCPGTRSAPSHCARQPHTAGQRLHGSPAGFFHQIRSIPARRHRHESLQPINPHGDSTRARTQPIFCSANSLGGCSALSKGQVSPASRDAVPGLGCSVGDTGTPT